jgi:AcrR family transcriptional regulator
MAIETDRTKIISRRSRPAKTALSQELIVSTALEILARDGVDGLSLRRVAAALDTGAASLYVYLENLDELYALMLDQALSAVRAPKSDQSTWRVRLKAMLASYFSALCKHRGLAQLAMSTIPCGPNSLRIWESLLVLLHAGGVVDTKAAWAVDLLTLYVTAIAAEHATRASHDQALARVKIVFAGLSRKTFPLVFAGREALLSGDGGARRDWAIDAIIDGIVGPNPPPRSKRKAAR